MNAAAGNVAANAAAAKVVKEKKTNSRFNINIDDFVFYEKEIKSQSQNNENNNNKIYKRIKCYCNDNSICPKDDPISKNANKNIEEAFEIDNDYLLNLNSFQIEQKETENKSDKMRLIDIDKLVNQTNGNIRHCITNTMCMTKRVLKSDGNYWHKYYCDQSSDDSIRGTIIEYRDCKINTQSAFDYNHVKKVSSEYCCNEKEFCNLNLHPVVGYIDFKDIPGTTNKYNKDQFPTKQTSTNDIKLTGASTTGFFLLNPINISLSVLMFLFLILIIFLVACFIFNKLKKSALKNKLKKQLSQQQKLNKQEKEQHEDKNYSSSSSTKSSLSACSHLTGTTGQSQYSPSTTTTGAAGDISNTFQTSASSNQFNHHNPHHNLLLAKGHHSFVRTPMHNGDNKIPLLQNLDHNNEDNYDDGYESRLKNTIIKNQDPMLISASTTDQSNKISSENLYSRNNIIINSPLSSTSQSSGFGCGASTSLETAQTASPTEFEWSGSGSGAGFPQCVQRTIARQIKLFYPCIGKGRFGEVYKGEWRGEHVAVKTFNSADEKSWENECNIYNTNGFRHESILGFIAADNIDRGTYTELWLITEFHEYGSLFDYLTLNSITPQQALNMAFSIVNGLVHLHMPIESCKGKPALAHCDLKSKNILVKNNLTCCIGDLGLALCGDKDGKIVQSSNVRTGTKRYMAPEILSKRIEIKYLDAFQKAEMYSLGLIFWELLRRCKFEDESTQTVYTFEYKPPYYEFINGDPDENIMKQVVCEQKHRPLFNPLWKQNFIMNEIVRLTEELWVEMPNERLNALRLKKSLNKIRLINVEKC